MIGLGVLTLGCELDQIEYPVRDESTFQIMHLGSLGDSFTAGFMSGGIEKTGQLACFANLLSKVMTGREMSLPLVDYPGIGSESGMTPLFVDETGDIIRDPLTVEPTDLALNLTYPAPYDNLGVPGSITRNLYETLEGGLFDLILRNVALPGGGTCLVQMGRLSPDIITAWSGNGEILGGVLDGNPQSDDPQAPAYVFPVEVFQTDFTEFCDRIEALNPKMVALANIPPFTYFPYARFFGTGSLPGINRWTMAEDLDGDDDPVSLVLLTAPIKACPECYLPSCEFNPATPCDTIPPEATLTVAERTLVEDAIAAYNAFIEEQADARGWALADVHAAFMALSGDDEDEPLNRAFPWLINPISGIGTKNDYSAFTLDGAHPSEKGHAYVANQFLAAFNDTYGTDYPLVDLADVENLAGFERAP
jgi:lysophospholipase L1-like esterase